MMFKNKNSSSQIKYSAVLSYITIFINILIGFLYTPWIVRKIGQSDFGLYTLSTSLISLVVFDFGLSMGVSRFLSIFNCKNEKEKTKKFLGMTYKIYFLLSLLIFFAFIIIFFNVEKIYSNFSREEITKFKFILILSGLFNIFTLTTKPFEGILISSENFIFIKSIEVISKLSIVFTMLVLLTLGFGLYALILTNITVGLLKVLINFLYIKKNIGFDVDFKAWDNKLFKESIIFSFWIAITSIFQRLILNVTPPLLGIFTNTIQIAIFSVGMTIEGYIWTISNALNGLFLPKVTRIIINEDKKKLYDLLLKLGRIQLFIVGFLIVTFLIFGKQFVVIWMGKNFVLSFFVGLYLILPFIIIQTQEILHTSLIVVNEVKYKAFATIIVSVLSILFILLFSKNYGAVGAAFGIMVAKIIGIVLFLNVVYYKLFKINLFKFFYDCHLKNSPLFIVIIILGFTLNKLLPQNNLLFFFLKIMIYSFSYTLILWFFFFNDFEKNLVKELINKFLRLKF